MNRIKHKALQLAIPLRSPGSFPHSLLLAPWSWQATLQTASTRALGVRAQKHGLTAEGPGGLWQARPNLSERADLMGELSESGCMKNTTQLVNGGFHFFILLTKPAMFQMVAKWRSLKEPRKS